MDPNTNPHLHRLRERGCSCLFRHTAAITASEYNCKPAPATPSLLTHSPWSFCGAAEELPAPYVCTKVAAAVAGSTEGASSTVQQPPAHFQTYTRRQNVLPPGWPFACICVGFCTFFCLLLLLLHREGAAAARPWLPLRALLPGNVQVTQQLNLHSNSC